MFDLDSFSGISCIFFFIFLLCQHNNAFVIIIIYDYSTNIDRYTICSFNAICFYFLGTSSSEKVFYLSCGIFLVLYYHFNNNNHNDNDDDDDDNNNKKEKIPQNKVLRLITINPRGMCSILDACAYQH